MSPTNISPSQNSFCVIFATFSHFRRCARWGEVGSRRTSAPEPGVIRDHHARGARPSISIRPRSNVLLAGRLLPALHPHSIFRTGPDPLSAPALGLLASSGASCGRLRGSRPVCAATRFRSRLPAEPPKQRGQTANELLLDRCLRGLRKDGGLQGAIILGVFQRLKNGIGGERMAQRIAARTIFAVGGLVRTELR